MYFIDVIRHGRAYAQEWKNLKTSMLSPSGEVDFDKVDTYLTEKSLRAGKPKATGRVLELVGKPAGKQRVSLKAPPFLARRHKLQHAVATEGQSGFARLMHQSALKKIEQARALKVDPAVIDAAQDAVNGLDIAWHANSQKFIDHPYFRGYNAALAALQLAVERAQRRAP